MQSPGKPYQTLFLHSAGLGSLFFSSAPTGIQQVSSGRNLRRAPSLLLLQKQCIGRTLWISGPHETPTTKARRHALHTMLPQSTYPGDTTVGVVGNQGLSKPLAGRFSNSPEFHKPDLENLPAPQPAAHQPLQPDSHFSSSPTGTTSSSLRKELTKQSPLRPCHRQPKKSPARVVPMARFRSRRGGPVIQKSAPFSTLFEIER